MRSISSISLPRSPVSSSPLSLDKDAGDKHFITLNAVILTLSSVHDNAVGEHSAPGHLSCIYLCFSHVQVGVGADLFQLCSKHRSCFITLISEVSAITASTFPMGHRDRSSAGHCLPAGVCGLTVSGCLGAPSGRYCDYSPFCSPYQTGHCR